VSIGSISTSLIFVTARYVSAVARAEPGGTVGPDRKACRTAPVSTTFAAGRTGAPWPPVDLEDNTTPEDSASGVPTRSSTGFCIQRLFGCAQGGARVGRDWAGRRSRSLHFMNVTRRRVTGHAAAPEDSFDTATVPEVGRHYSRIRTALCGPTC